MVCRSDKTEDAERPFSRETSVTQKKRTILSKLSLAATGALLLTVSGTVQAQVRVGSTFAAIPGDGIAKRFPDVAFDEANDAFLVVTGLSTVEARYVTPAGAPLGSTVKVSTTTAGASRVACAASINKCLIVWLQEPRSVIGRLVRYNAGSVQALTSPFVINGALAGLQTNSAPGVVYSSASNEFLVAWTEYSPGPNIKARRVDGNGAPVGAMIPIAVTTLWEGFPTLAYNSVQNEYNVGYYFESSGASCVGTQLVKPGTGALIGGRSTLYSGGFNQYPELAYNSATNQYLAISWGYSGGQWMIRGRLANSDSQPLGASTLALAAKGGGDGIGLGYNPVSNTYLADYQSQTNSETWGVEIGAAGGPGTQIQLSMTGTTLSVQPRAEASTGDDRWLMVTSNAFRNIVAQVVGHRLAAPGTGGTGGTGGGTGACTTPKPGANFVCVNGNWLPGTGGTGGCKTPSPGTGFTCVNGNWLPPSTGGTSGTCKTAKPAANWVCVNGNWLPPWMAPPTSSCTTPKPGTNFVCVNGNWLPGDGGTGGSSTCTTIKPGSTWTCVNGNWLPPWY